VHILSDVLFKKAPVYCKTSRTARDLIRKKQITDYIFAKLNDTNWVISDGKSYKYDKVFFKKEFIDTIPEINQTGNYDVSIKLHAEVTAIIKIQVIA
jgi:ribosomal protein L9